MCKFSSKSGGVPFQPLGDLTWNDPSIVAPYSSPTHHTATIWEGICILDFHSLQTDIKTNIPYFPNRMHHC